MNPEPTITIADQGLESPLTWALKVAFDAALKGVSIPDERVRTIDGFCGQKHRAFFNILTRMVEEPRYLEVGVFRGATLCAAISGNRVRALGIDNWTEYGGKANEFYSNLAVAKDAYSSVSILEQDFRSVPYSHLGKFNIYFYDGPHEYQDQYDGIKLALPALDKRSIVLVDDWNWQQVRDGTLNALTDAGATVELSIELRTTLDNNIPQVAYGSSDWHNGIFAAVIHQPGDASD